MEKLAVIKRNKSEEYSGAKSINIKNKPNIQIEIVEEEYEANA